MIHLLVDYINADNTVDVVTKYKTDDVNACFKDIHQSMLSTGVPKVRIHIDKNGRWASAGFYTQQTMRSMIDEDC